MVWLGSLAGQGAVLDAGVHASRIAAYMVAPATSSYVTSSLPVVPPPGS